MSRRLLRLLLVGGFAIFAYDYLEIGDVWESTMRNTTPVSEKLKRPVPPSEPATSQEPQPAEPVSPSEEEEKEREQSQFRLVRSVATYADQAVVDTRIRIRDMERLVDRVESDVRSLDRIDPVVRRDAIQEIRDVRGQALQGVNDKIDVLPRTIATMKEQLSGVTLAGSGELINLRADAESDIEWLETEGMTTLESVRERLLAIRVPQ